MPQSSAEGGRRTQVRRGLYALVDADACLLRGLDVVEAAYAMMDAEVAVLQVRAKQRPANVVFDLVLRVALRKPNATLLFVNDRADVAQLVRADGVHVGQCDLSPTDVSVAFPELRVGVSTHDPSQLALALDSAADYVAYGPVFATSSKLNPEPAVGLTGLADAGRTCARRDRHLVAIGGIGDREIGEVAPHCDSIAAISALLPDAHTVDPYSAIRRRAERVQARIRQVVRLGVDPG